ncbi:MAG: hypothetical protein ABFQ89_01505 [Chloroflexota bacterium]
MRTFRIVALSITLAVVLFVMAPSAIAAPSDVYDRIISSGTFHLEDGELEDGTIVVTGGEVIIDDGATLTEDLIVFGGTIKIGGTIAGDVILFAGELSCSRTAVVRGNFVALGGDHSINTKAQIDGDYVNKPADEWIPEIFHSRAFATTEPELQQFTRWQPLIRMVTAVVGAVIVGLIALFYTSVWPDEVERVAGTIKENPVSSMAAGLVSYFALLFIIPLWIIISALLILVCIGIFGFPLLAGFIIALILIALFGWTGIGLIVGRWFWEQIGSEQDDIRLMASATSAVLWLLIGWLSLASWIFALVGLVAFLAVTIAFGGALLSHMGRRVYQPGDPIFIGSQSIKDSDDLAPMAAKSIVSAEEGSGVSDDDDVGQGDEGTDSAI